MTRSGGSILGMSHAGTPGIDRLRAVVLGFAVGDALGAPFEDDSPTPEEIEGRLRGSETIRFTDDTYLVLSTMRALAEAGTPDWSSWLYWEALRAGAVRALVAWAASGDHRGVGDTTWAAIKQMTDHLERARAPAAFELRTHGYDVERSAGNGILSRALPLVTLGVRGSPELARFLALTHLHPKGHEVVDAMICAGSRQAAANEESPPSGLGFYAPEALAIATFAAAATTWEEAFRRSQVPDGDNDSTAALALGLWGLTHDAVESDSPLSQLGRMAGADRSLIERACERVITPPGACP